MHLWPAGSEHVAFEVAAESTLTVCGLVIGEHNFERLPRGWWRDRARTMNTRCAVCESDASSFPETTESIDRMIFPAQTNMELIFRQVLLECVNKNVLDLTGRGHSRGFEKASGAAVASFRRTLQSQALTRLQAGSQPLLSRVLAGQTSEYTTTKALAQLSQKQWNELTEPLLPRRWQAVNTRPTSYLQDQMTRRRTFVRGLRRALETAL
jgi:hypothetical protein